MNKKIWSYFRNFLIIGLLTMLFASVVALADTTPVLTGTGDFGAWIGEAVNDYHVWGSVGIFAAVALGLKLLVDLLNVSFIYQWYGKLSPKIQLIIVHVLAALTAGIGIKASGGSWLAAAGATIVASGGAVYLDQLLSNLFGLSIAIAPAAAPAQAQATTPPSS